MIESGEGFSQKLERGEYRIDIYNDLNIGVTLHIWRTVGSKDKDHGRVTLSKKDIEELIENLEYMKDNIEFLEF